MTKLVGCPKHRSIVPTTPILSYRGLLLGWFCIACDEVWPPGQWVWKARDRHGRFRPLKPSETSMRFAEMPK